MNISASVIEYREVLIETLWNVKYLTLSRIAGCTFVLIETLWNVKLNTLTTVFLADVVLIETLWNVNTSEYRARKLLKSVL